MGAASVDLPTIMLTGGPMLNGKWKGQDIGSGTDLWRFSEAVRSGQMSCEDFVQAESCMARSNGHCMTMGTASTMACMVESLGLTLPGGASIPAADSRRSHLAHLVGMEAVRLVHAQVKLSQILTRDAMENAIMVNAAIGGSTNFIIHLLAIAGRIGVPLTLDDFDRISSNIPLLVNLMPSGKYLMEDFYYAGGLPVVLRELESKLHGESLTVNGRSIRENNADAICYNTDVIRTMAEPLLHNGGSAVCKGNLAPKGAVIKPSAATPALMKHRGQAVVFEDIEDYHARINSSDLPVDRSSVLVLKNVGPRGYPGMPEVGNFGLPKKLLDAGVTDMVRISDGRMSGTAFGTVFLHVSPESALGGPLALVRNGDWIEVDVESRRLHLDISDAELNMRMQDWSPNPPVATRGYAGLYVQHVLGADQGADMDFLIGGSGSIVTRDSH